MKLGLIGILLLVVASAQDIAGPSQEQAIAAIKKLGGKVKIDEKSPGRPVIELRLSYTKITDAGLVHLKGLTNLKTLWLFSTKVTDAGVKKLQAALPKCKISR